LGWLVQHHGWNTALAGLVITAALSTVMFALAWKAKPHGYEAAAADAENELREATASVPDNGRR
jgi:sugar phosphate permease